MQLYSPLHCSSANVPGEYRFPFALLLSALCWLQPLALELLVCFCLLDETTCCHVSSLWVAAVELGEQVIRVYECWPAMWNDSLQHQLLSWECCLESRSRSRINIFLAVPFFWRPLRNEQVHAGIALGSPLLWCSRSPSLASDRTPLPCSIGSNVREHLAIWDIALHLVKSCVKVMLLTHLLFTGFGSW